MNVFNIFNIRDFSFQPKSIIAFNENLSRLRLKRGKKGINVSTSSESESSS